MFAGAGGIEETRTGMLSAKFGESPWRRPG